MINKESINEIIEDYLSDGEIFMTHLSVSRQNTIRVFLDGDKGVTIADCSRLSRHIETQLDRDLEDFDLVVSSVGVDEPLNLLRQYRKNLGRRLSIITNENIRLSGKLLDVNEQGITLEKDKQAKGKKKKKEPETDSEARMFLPFDQINEAKVLVSFK